MASRTATARKKTRRRTRAETARPVRVGIVAGEVSGDLLAAGLMRALKHRFQHIAFEGIGGAAMREEGCRSLYPMERLSLIGFEVLEKLPGLLRMRRDLAAHFIANPPDVFIGVDAPDFNLGLEAMLKRTGVRTVHYVSPTVWAWRRWRIRTIRRGVDLMLTLFPFEASFYHQHNVPVAFVGHPLADAIPERYEPKSVRRELKVPTTGTLIALLPGSRVSELSRHADLFVKTALWLATRHPNLRFVAPFVDARTRGIFERALKANHAGHLPITRVIGRSRDAMAAADVVLLASGTATLEAAMLQKPMVVTYRIAWLSYLLVRLLVRVRDYALPNLLAGRRIVPELLQADAVPDKLGAAVQTLFTRRAETRRVTATLAQLHRALKRNASERAADAVARLLRRTRNIP